MALCVIPPGLFLVFEAEWKGPWIDRLLASAVERRLGVPVDIKGARARATGLVQFDSMRVRAHRGRDLATGGGGTLHFLPGSLTITWSRINVAPSPELGWPLLTWGVHHVLNEPLIVNRLKLAIIKKSGRITVQLLEWESPQLKALGSIESLNGVIDRVDLTLFFEAGLLGRIPEDYRRRLVPGQNGWSGGRLIYADRCLTVMGATGPLFQAQTN